MAEEKERGALYNMGCWISTVVSDAAAHPYAQIGVIAACVTWFAVGLPADILTAALSIIAITLTQMVLNRQNEREVDAHRRDVAMHVKLDELLVASRRARNEVAGIEEQTEEEIEKVKAGIVAAERTAERAADEAAGSAVTAQDKAKPTRFGT